MTELHCQARALDPKWDIYSDETTGSGLSHAYQSSAGNPSTLSKDRERAAKSSDKYFSGIHNMQICAGTFHILIMSSLLRFGLTITTRQIPDAEGTYSHIL